MDHFFQVKTLEEVFGFCYLFDPVETETIDLLSAVGRVVAQDVETREDIPGFSRSTMDGYAVSASSTFGASEANPAYLTIKGAIGMGDMPAFEIGPGQAAKIATGGMLPPGTDGVVMVEHTESVDESTIEVFKTIAPGQHIIEKGEDYERGQVAVSRSNRLRPQEIGVLAATGNRKISVYRKPVVSIISTGDEIIPIDEQPKPGQIRDMNSYTLAGLVMKNGGIPRLYPIVKDKCEDLIGVCKDAIDCSDMVLISGGSSVGTRDFTIEAIQALESSQILVHGISISPGKPTILARAGDKPIWGLPGHVTSAMVVFDIVVVPFLNRLCGLDPNQDRQVALKARLARNIASVSGRTDFVRVRLVKLDSDIWAHPVLGKSGLINTMVHADGLIEIGLNEEGKEEGDEVAIIPI